MGEHMRKNKHEERERGENNLHSLFLVHSSILHSPVHNPPPKAAG